MGKTTLVETVMGLLPAREGSIDLDGNELAGKSPFQIARQGVALVPQGRRVFSSLTVEENLTLGARRTDSANQWTLERVYDLFPNLSKRRRNRGSDLSGGEQQMLAIGRAVMTNPRVLVMDEPSEGLAPVIVDLVGTVINQLREQGLCVLLVEQNYGLAMDVADKVYLLSSGEIVWDGTPQELEQSPEVRHEYLGV
jgi:branched-chain amino acid transport system ATP-binding protein